KAKPADSTRTNSRNEKEKIWERLDSADLRTLVARLRAAGFSPGLVRAMVYAKALDNLDARVRPLLVRAGEFPFWKQRPTDPIWGDTGFREALNQAHSERSRGLREALGDDFFLQAGGDAGVLQRRQLGDLPAAKIDRVQQIIADYDEMAAQVRAERRGITLPEDHERLALLEREKRVDLAAVLSPAELADYELRTSRVTSRLREALTLIDASEAEFRAIHEVHRRHDDLINPLAGFPSVLTPEYLQQREAAYREIADELKAILGEQRQTELARASTREFQELARFAARENLPRETIVRAFDLREHVARESNRIADDTSLSAAHKRAALQALAEGTRAQLNATLGATVASAYIGSSARWLSAVEDGRVIAFGPEGTWRSTRSLR
ncbi:MAG: hypothetical protein ABIZ49_10880, partial [Opitutaceae bacterium]